MKDAVFVRAKLPNGKWVSADVMDLADESFKSFVVQCLVKTKSVAAMAGTPPEELWVRPSMAYKYMTVDPPRTPPPAPDPPPLLGLGTEKAALQRGAQWMQSYPGVWEELQWSNQPFVDELLIGIGYLALDRDALIDKLNKEREKNK